jgi:LuxR family maltose regulon positive regulatory protein
VTELLLRTKLHIPTIRPSHLPRPQLQAKLNRGLHSRLTLVAAPAGFGKTTLVAACLARYDQRAAWLSLDPEDNQPNRFLNYLLASLQKADRAIGHDAAGWLTAVPPAAHAAILTSLVNDLDTTAGELALVLDDYQFIDHQDVHQAVSFLLQHAPQTFHLVIISRADPPLPLARLRARGQLVELRAADLRFTQQEAERFLIDVMKLQLDAEEVTALAGRTEGWIASLQMAALSLQDRKEKAAFINGFSGTHRYILDYLLEEVLNRESPETESFLLRTALLDRFNAPLCAAVTGKRGSRRILENLERRHLFLVPLDEERNWFRYHHLFAEMLRARLRQTWPDEESSLHQRAAAWLEQNGWITQAGHHLIAAGEPERAAALIEQHGATRLAQNDLAVLQMADRLPPEIISSHPKISLYRAWLHILQGQISAARPLLQVPAMATGSAWMQTVAAVALAFLTPSTADGQWKPLPAPEKLEAIPAAEPLLRNAAEFLYAMALDRRGDLDGAVAFAEKCIVKEKREDGALQLPALVPFLTRGYLLQGRLHEVAAECCAFLDALANGINGFFTRPAA